MTDRRRAAVAMMTVGAAVTILGTLLTWVRSGGADRNSYDVFRLVGRLGFAPDGPVSAALRWWPLMPLLAVVAVVAAWWRRPRAGGLVGLIAASYAAAVAIAVLSAPARGLVEIGLGPAVSVGGAAVLLGGSVGVLVTPTALAARAPHGAEQDDPS